jgi:hypothetical protein
VVNTIQKMAQKRALVAATLLAVNASEFFTQDGDEALIEAPPEAAVPASVVPEPAPPPQSAAEARAAYPVRALK